jgi:hypothetical protein
MTEKEIIIGMYANVPWHIEVLHWVGTDKCLAANPGSINPPYEVDCKCIKGMKPYRIIFV